MNDLRAAAQQALEALIHMCHNTVAEKGYDGQRVQDAIDGLKAALAQPEINAWRDAVDNELVSLHMVASDDPRESIQRLINWNCAVHIDPLVSSAAQDLIERGKREALKQQDTKPSAEVVSRAQIIGFGRIEPRKDVRFLKDLKIGTMLYTDVPRRKWVSLTEEEIGDVFQAARNAKLGSANDNSRHRLSVVEIARAIEQALKERNNG